MNLPHGRRPSYQDMNAALLSLHSAAVEGAGFVRSEVGSLATGLAPSDEPRLAAAIVLTTLCALLAFRLLGDDGLAELWGAFS